MKEIGISVSPKQASRMRNGHSVRVKGGGITLMVDPERYDSLSQTFKSGRGKQITLSPMEIQANRAVTGGGIFGPKFDKLLDKAGIRKGAYMIGDMAKPALKKAIDTITAAAPAAGAAAAVALATASGNPELAPVAGEFGRRLGTYAGNYANKHSKAYLDDPQAYQDDPRKKLMGGAIDDFNPNDNMVRDGRIRRLVKDAKADLAKYGSGLYASSRGGAIVGLDGGMVSMGHPALQSQAQSALFQQQFTLPPSYQWRGGGLYA